MIVCECVCELTQIHLQNSNNKFTKSTESTSTTDASKFFEGTR